ncbi:MAG TPA: O-antigen ligase family protein [Sphingomonas sp.]|nr:O-antigen ligase family protein [Sphingomonas sp.]
MFAAIPVLQLVPLPPAIWHQLPGREVEIQALALVGRADAWMPVSESPPRTIASALSLIPPLAMLFMVSRLRERDRTTLIGVLAALGLLAAVVGVIQLASGNANWLRFYEITNYGFATGFQANHNADADVLLVGLIALVAWAFADGRIAQSSQNRLLVAAMALFLILSVVLTGSRAGVALIVVAVAASVAIGFRRSMWKSRRIGAAVVLGLVVLGGAGYFLTHNARVERTLARFDDGEAIRPEIWKDTGYAIGQHWPVGSGMGTFQPIFTAAERLEFVRPDYSNRAHDDYLEFVLEAGVVAPIFLVAIVIFAALRLKRMMLGNTSRDRQIKGILILGSLAVLFLHSVVDYPMRAQSLGVVAGLLAGLLGRSGRVAAGLGRLG